MVLPPEFQDYRGVQGIAVAEGAATSFLVCLASVFLDGRLARVSALFHQTLIVELLPWLLATGPPTKLF